MKVTVDIDPTNVGSVFGSVKKALLDPSLQTEVKRDKASLNISNATKLLASLEALYSAKNSIEFYHYLGNFIETMGSMSNVRSLVPVFGTNPVSEYFQVIAESQYSEIVNSAFANIASLAYMCAEGILRTKKHTEEFRKTHSRREDVSENPQESKITTEEEELVDISDCIIRFLSTGLEDTSDLKIYLKKKES